MPLLELKNVSYESDGKTILDNISLRIDAGDCVSIMGPSGSGKSTLLRLCSHLISPTGGVIVYNGKSLEAYNPIQLRRSIAYCFQTPYLFGDTVLDNIKFPYAIRNLRIDQNRVRDLFEMIGLTDDYLARDVKDLSGGEKQRIAFIRSLLFRPEILLLDEITSALDSENASAVERVVKAENEAGTTVLWVTHDPLQSRRIADTQMIMEAGKLKSWEVLR
ncbi:ATP-binding cassette domain-containing protein [Oscillospiraceae bacterium CM]|nr:ATP-binding cassette domain-containing protein [Oscillospiraceae bacterium CM]